MGREVRGHDGEGKDDANPLQTWQRGREMGEGEKGVQGVICPRDGLYRKSEPDPNGHLLIWFWCGARGEGKTRHDVSQVLVSLHYIQTHPSVGKNHFRLSNDIHIPNGGRHTTAGRHITVRPHTRPD